MYICVNCSIYFSLHYNIDFNLLPYLRPTLYETRNIGVRKCMCYEIVSEMFVKVTSNRTIKTLYIAENKNISNIKVIDKSLINFTGRYIIFYDCCKVYKVRHVVFNP